MHVYLFFPPHCWETHRTNGDVCYLLLLQSYKLLDNKVYMYVNALVSWYTWLFSLLFNGLWLFPLSSLFLSFSSLLFFISSSCILSSCPLSVLPICPTSLLPYCHQEDQYKPGPDQGSFLFKAFFLAQLPARDPGSCFLCLETFLNINWN